MPELKWNVASRYNFEMLGMNSFVQASYTFVGESYNLLYDIDSVSRTRRKQGDYSVGNISLGVDNGSWSAELFVKNVGDERGEVFINGATYDQRVTSNRPRTIGLRFRQKFG